MEIYYEGKNITDSVIPKKCIARDTCGERCDSLEIEFENAEDWIRWGPQQDDKILVTQDGYDTGTMYVNTVIPADGKYQVWATSLPCAARKKDYRSFAGKSIEEIMRQCAMSTGMDFRLFGVDKGTIIPYIQQNNESAAAFLHRLLMLEGATLKCVNGAYVAIGLLYAQERAAHQSIEITARQRGVDYTRNGAKLESYTIRTPYASATANDLSRTGQRLSAVTGKYPAVTDIQAGRWARGLLLQHNRGCECLRIRTEYNIGFTAMTRIDVGGSTDAAGQWLIEEVEHDLMERTSTVKLHRCVTTIQ